MQTTRDTSTLFAFIAMTVIGGGNAVSIKIGLAELDPFWSAAVRFSLASLIMLVLMRMMSLRLPRGRALAGAVIYGCLNFGLAFAFAYYALTEVTAGTTQVAIAMTPVFVVMLSAVHGIERLTLRGLAGSLIALTGTAIIFADSLQSAPVIKVLALLATVICFAEAALTIKRFPRVHPLTENAVGQGTGGIMLLMISFIAGERWHIPVEPDTLGSLGFLILFGSVVLFGLYVLVISRWTASAASYALVAMPIFTVIFAAILLDETVTPLFFAGSAAVVLGIYLGVFSKPQTRQA